MQKTLSEGSIFRDHYRVEKLLGKGGFGAVYLVRDVRGQHNVYALKEIIDTDPRERRHFASEAEILKRLEHPSLPHLYYMFDDPDHWRAYMLMDYIEGPNLEHLRRQRPGRRLSVEETIALLNPVFEAITYLHAQQPPVIHRDIKPSNIIVPVSGTATVLVDLGIAKEFDQEGTTSIIRYASPGYGAPEQYVLGTDMRTDIYGLGATIYTLLTGVVPADAFFRLTNLAAGRKDPLLPINQLVPALSNRLSQTITQAMELEKTRRFASVEDFRKALQTEKPVWPTTTSRIVSTSALRKHFATAPLFRSAAAIGLPRKRVIVPCLAFLILGFSLVSPTLLASQKHSHLFAAASSSTVVAQPTPVATAQPTPSTQPSSVPQPAKPAPAVQPANQSIPVATQSQPDAATSQHPPKPTPPSSGPSKSAKPPQKPKKPHPHKGSGPARHMRPGRF